ncbi:MAG: ABC transporter permease [Bacteroidota bacterium]
MNLLFSLKMSLRSLRKRPVFSAVIIFTFAIVTSTSIIVYSYFDALLLSPLPFKDSEKLVRIQSIKGGEKGLLSYPEFLDMQKALEGVEDLAVYRDGGRYNLSGDGQPPEDLTTTFASSNLFSVLGIEPVIGSYWPQTLDEQSSHTVMLAHEFWQRRFSSDPNVEMLEINLDGFSYLNYGVLPEGFSFPGRTEAFRAMAFADFVLDAREFRPCIGLARLRPGVTLKEFNDELSRFAASQEQTHADTNLGITFEAEPLSDLYYGEIYGYMLLLGGAVLFLLTIAVINVSNLIVNQAIRKSKETVVRKVLGSSNVAIISDFVVHCFTLSLLGSLGGLFIASSLIEVTYELLSPYLPYWVNVGINQSVLLYTLLTAVLLGLITGILPWFFHLSGGSFVKRLKEGQQTVGSKRQHGIQKGLASSQILASVVLMIGGTLMFKSFMEASKTDLGFATEDKQTFRIALAWFKYGSPEKKKAFFENSLQRIEAISGVENVAMNSILPLSDMVNTSTQSQENFTTEGQSDVEQSENPFISVQRVTPNYFEVMGISMDIGATFDEADPSAHRYQVIIDKQLANKMWPKESALGKRIKLGGPGSERPYLTVVGVTNDVKHQSIMGDNIPSVYVSLMANTTTDAYYVINSKRPLSELEPALSQSILDIDENQPTFEYMPLTDIVAVKNWQAKVASTLFLTIAIIGSIIAAIGLFSMMTFILTLRVKELALRRVLGATDGSVIKLMFKDMLRIAGIGIVLGIILSPILLRLIAPFLFEVNIMDISIYVLVTASLLLVSLLATLVPFRNALFVNPVKVLRRD